MPWSRPAGSSPRTPDRWAQSWSAPAPGGSGALRRWSQAGEPGRGPDVKTNPRVGVADALCEYEIRDEDGTFLGTVDFAWPDDLAGLEYDGDSFHSPRRWAADDRRQDRIETIGWRIERADRNDLRPSSDRLRLILESRLTRSPRLPPRW